MKTIAAREAKSRFSMLLDDAQREPVVIQQEGHAVAVVLSMTEYARLEALEDAYWLARAREAEAEGYLGAAEGEQMLRELLDAPD